MQTSIDLLRSVLRLVRDSDSRQGSGAVEKEDAMQILLGAR